MIIQRPYKCGLFSNRTKTTNSSILLLRSRSKGGMKMYYVIQNKAMPVEAAELIEELKHDDNNKIIYADGPSTFDWMKETKEWMKTDVVPIGTLEFVQKYLSVVHNINTMNPIEIPKELRLPHLLLRDYKIVQYDELPHNGQWFIKDVSKLKQFSYCGSMDTFFNDESFKQYSNQLDPSHLYQVSEIIPIVAEYRVIVIEDKIYGIQFYDGEPTTMPTSKEIAKIREAVGRYSLNNARPRAYTIDVAIIMSSTNKDLRDLALLEIHPAVAIDTYGCRGSFLPKMYRLGLDWYLKHNTELET